MDGDDQSGGRIALVQGASRGIGLEFVRQLANDPATQRVIATCRQPAGADGLASLRVGGDKIHVVPLDVADELSVAVAAHEVAGITDRIDLIVNTAGILHEEDQQPERRLNELRADHLQRSFAVNAIGPMLVARYFESLLARGRQAVFASLSARVGSIGDNRLGGWYAYRASKAALNMFMKTLSIEWARRKDPITCIALHPGTVDTDLSRPFQKGMDADRVFSVGHAVEQLLGIIDDVGPGDTGRFIAWDGQTISW